MNTNIKTWQERTGNHNVRPGSTKHMQAEIADLRAALALAQAPSAPVAPQAAEDWLRQRYGAARGHHAWRDLAEAFNAGAALSVKAGQRAAIHRRVLQNCEEGPDVVGPTVCTVPPAGSYCTRAPGHDGPCAAYPAAAPTPPTTGEAIP